VWFVSLATRRIAAFARAESEQEQLESDDQQHMNEIAVAVDYQNTDDPRNEKSECGPEHHVASGAATRSGNEQNGYALEVVGDACREIESVWRAEPAETASGAAPDIFIRSFHGR